VGLLALAGVTIGAFILNPTGNGLSFCGLQRTAGVPCPGCGLTRSVTSFLHGHLAWSWHYNPLGPLVAVGMLLVAIGAVLPASWRKSAIERLSPHERRLGWFLMALCVILLAHGIWRIVLVATGNADYAWWHTETLPPFVDP